MLIAIPVNNNKLDLHFGHCKEFALIKVNSETKKIISRENVTSPPHEPGLLPRWLAKLGVTMVIAGGIGQRAKELLNSSNIDVLVGALQKEPEVLVEDYLQGVLTSGNNCCDH